MKEFKIVELKKEKKSYELTEKSLSEYSAEGWEVVSMTVDVSSNIGGVVVILLQRDI